MRNRAYFFMAMIVVSVAPRTSAAEEKAFPPGWLPIQRLDDATPYADFRKVDDKIHLYLPPKVDTVRGVFVCYVFHSADPRELARLWKFALVTVPWPFEYDLGMKDRRNPRIKLGHPLGDMSFLLRYLETAAKETKHPELAAVPIVGWLGQNGAGLCADLEKRAPGRVLAWGDAWYGDWPKHPELIATVPVASAWELSDERKRREQRDAWTKEQKEKLTPATDLRCYANTFGFKHGIYSKFNFFAAYLDRCISLRMPDEMPAAGQPVKLKPLDPSKGWVGDFNEISEWAAIAPAKEARGMIGPTYLPDEYFAWAWRSYHSANPDLRIVAPVQEYRAGGGKQYGLGYGGQVTADAPLKFAAESKGEYAKIEFRDGNRLLGTADKAPWQVENVKLSRGLHVLFAVGVTAEGGSKASRPAFLIGE